ncbi:MAG: YihA family ribosome biogenesis GTP-binding protein [Cyclobacteriaceae bacterium]
MNPVKTAEFVKSSARVEDCPPATMPEYAFIGRSNVGKSSLINLLTNHGKLAKVSSKPGKTQLINHFLIDKEWYLVDLPGYGWAKVSKSSKADWKKMIARYFETRENLTNVFVLIDSRLEPQQIDIDFVNSLGEAGLPMTMVFTKVDKKGANKAHSHIAAFRKILKREWDELPEYFMTSNVTGQGKEEILKHIRTINKEIAK